MPCLYGGVAIVAATIIDPPRNNTRHVITTGDNGGISLPLVENQHANSSRNAGVFRRDKACLVYTTSATTTTAQLIE